MGCGGSQQGHFYFIYHSFLSLIWISLLCCVVIVPLRSEAGVSLCSRAIERPLWVNNSKSVQTGGQTYKTARRLSTARNLLCKWEESTHAYCNTHVHSKERPDEGCTLKLNFLLTKTNSLRNCFTTAQNCKGADANAHRSGVGSADSSHDKGTVPCAYQ